MRNKITIIIILIIAMFILTGCWDQRDPEKLALVLVGGYDFNSETGMYKIITQIESPMVPQGGDNGGAGDKPPYWTVSAWGYSAIDAVSNIKKKVSRRLSYSHMHLLVLSETIVREKGIVQVLDALFRTRESRPVLNIVVATGDVEELLSAEIPIATTNGLGLLNLIEITDSEIGTAIKISGREFITSLSSPGKDPVTTYIELKEDKSENSNPTNLPSPLKISGLAAFKNEIMSGFLNDREARGWKWIEGKEKIGIINFPYPGATVEENLITVRATGNRIKLIPRIEGRKSWIEISLQIKGKIECITGRASIGVDISDLQSMENRLAQVVRNDIRAAIVRARELESDIFGFENAFYRQEYEYWQQEGNKQESLFLQIPVDIIVKAVIDKSGLTEKSIIVSD